MKKTATNQQGHQGDVQFKEISSLPETAKSIKKQPLAYGEVSGHIHIITGDYDLFEDERGFKYAKIGNDGASLQHVFDKNFNNDFTTKEKLPIADHKQIDLKPNSIFQIGIQKQYNPFSKIWERVID